MPPQELQDLIDALAQTPDIVAGLIKDLSEHDVTIRNSPDEFSVIENVCHLRDIEIEGYAARISRILREDNPLLPDIDGGRLAVERDYQRQDLAEALQRFADARKENTQTLTGLVNEQFDRKGTLEGVGSVSIRGLVLLMRDHDAGHICELTSIRERPDNAESPKFR